MFIHIKMMCDIDDKRIFRKKKLKFNNKIKTNILDLLSIDIFLAQ